MLLSINGASLFCESAGKPDAPVVIVLHGGRGSSDHRADFAAFRGLADEFHVFSYDQRGYGMSQHAEPLNPGQLVDDLEAVRAAVAGERPVTLIAFSFGGFIALQYALKYQQGLSSLVLIGTAASHHFEETALLEFDRRASRAPMAMRGMAEKRLRDGILDDTEFRMILFAMSPIYDPDVRPDEALEAARMAVVSADVHRRLYMGQDYDLRDRLSEIEVPALLVCGENDWICPPEFRLTWPTTCRMRACW